MDHECLSVVQPLGYTVDCMILWLCMLMLSSSSRLAWQVVSFFTLMIHTNTFSLFGSQNHAHTVLDTWIIGCGNRICSSRLLHASDMSSEASSRNMGQLVSPCYIYKTGHFSSFLLLHSSANCRRHIWCSRKTNILSLWYFLKITRISWMLY